MTSAEHRLGTCVIIASARLRGDQPVQAQGVTAIASKAGEAHIRLTVGKILIYIEDRAAFEALRRAMAAADQAADRVFGPQR